MSRDRATRRKNSIHKAIRKRRIVNEVYGWSEGWYDNLHQYADNKIHCSCPMCSAKTNAKKKFYGGCNMTIADQKKMAYLYYEDEEENNNGRD